MVLNCLPYVNTHAYRILSSFRCVFAAVQNSGHYELRHIVELLHMLWRNINSLKCCRCTIMRIVDGKKFTNNDMDNAFLCLDTVKKGINVKSFKKRSHEKI